MLTTAPAGFLLRGCPFLLIWLLAVVSFPAAASPVDESLAPNSLVGKTVVKNPAVTVLIYHRIGDDRYPSTNVSVEALREQLVFLRENDYRFLSPEQFEAVMEGREPGGERDVLVTIDDGYRSLRDNGLPLFQEFGVPIVVFLSTESVERGYPDMLPWEAVEKLQGPMVRFENHSHGHPHTARRAPGETVAAYTQRLAADTERAQTLLEDHGIRTTWYAFPYGEWTPAFEKVLRSLGYRWIFTQDPGVAEPGTGSGNPIPRMAVVGGRGAMEEFRANVSRLPLGAELLEPRDGWVGGEISGIRIRVPGMAAWGTGEVNLFLSEMGRFEPVVEQETGTMSVTGPIPLERQLNRIILTARDRVTNRYRMKSWLLVKP